MKLIFESRQVAHQSDKIRKLKANGWRVFYYPKRFADGYALSSRYRAYLAMERSWYKKFPTVADGIREVERLLKIDVTIDTDAVGAFVHVFYWREKGGRQTAYGWDCIRHLHPKAKATPRETAAALEDALRTIQALEGGFVGQTSRRRRRDGPLFGSRGD